MVDKDEVSHDHGACSLDVGEEAHTRVYCVERVACNVEDQIVQGESLNATLRQKLRFEFPVLV